MQPPTFDRKTIDHLASLAALSLSDAEAEGLARELGAIVAYVEELGAVDTSAVETTLSEAASPAPWREDVPSPGLSREEALRSAPRATDVGFAVPGFVPVGSAGGGER
jgi:aspartyl-tRNA(Asn)/glutamyl-tRNA(Gln) amidotransferase subunit C